jgi:hypothetical protein
MFKPDNLKSLWEAMLVVGITKLDLTEEKYLLHRSSWRKYMIIFVRLASNSVNMTYEQISKQLNVSISLCSYYCNSDKYFDRDTYDVVLRRYEKLTNQHLKLS